MILLLIYKGKTFIKKSRFRKQHIYYRIYEH